MFDDDSWEDRYFYAAQRGDEALVQQLLAEGAAAEADDLGYTPLDYAVHRGDEALVRQLLAAGASIDRFDDLGYTPLHHAAKHGYLKVMELLLAAGADVDARAPDDRIIGETPLGEVAGDCTYEVAKILIDAGADPLIPGFMQVNALDKAQRRKRPEGLRVIELLERAVKVPLAKEKVKNHRSAKR